MNETESNAAVRAAIEATRATLPDYWRTCLAQRTTQRAPGASTTVATAGSRYDLTPEALEAALQAAAWRPFVHPDLAAGCRAFACDLPGRVGIVAVATLPVEAMLTLDDPKQTGWVEATVRDVLATEHAAETVIILGPEGGTEVVYTVHPGPPVRPSRLPAADHLGRVVTVADARALGLEWAKLT